MAGNNSIRGDETITFTDNMSFDGTERGGKMTTDGQLWIGSTASRHVKLGDLTSPNGSITIGYSSPNITLELAGGTLAFDSIMVDTVTATGVNPVVPTAAGLVTFTGGQYPSGTFGTRVIDINSQSPNNLQILSQISASNATTLITKNGISHFDSAIFTVDANGFVSVAGTGFIKTITGNSGGAESPAGGNFNILGTGSITVAGSANTETVQLTGLTNHSLQVGAGTATLTQLGVGATGTILIGNTAADPSFSATPAVTSIVLSGGTALSTYITNTFLPLVRFGGGSTGITYSVQSGQYTIIGNCVHINISAALSNKGSSTGLLTINGLPYQNNGGAAHLFLTCAAVTLAGATYFDAVVNGGTSGALIYSAAAAAGTITQLADTNCTNTSTFQINGFYFT